jgi:hypothetical protein
LISAETASDAVTVSADVDIGLNNADVESEPVAVSAAVALKAKTAV